MARNPPPEHPVRTFPSPDITDQVVLEWVTSEMANSAPVAPGTAHPNTRDFPNFKLGKQVVNPADHNFFIRYYVKDQPSPDTFSPAWNYALKYSGQANSYPVVIRSYRKLKSGYTPLTKGTALSDFAGAVLIEEEATQFPPDSEFFALYFNVIRVYETLPGPLLPFTRYDDDLGPIQGTRQAVLWASQAAAVTATTKTTYEAREGSSIVAWKLVETWSDGTGGAGNPAYPILKTDFYDNERGAVHQASQIVANTTSVGSLTVAAGTVTQIRYEPYADNPNLRKKIIETWAVPSNLFLDQPRYDKDLGIISSYRQLVVSGSTATQEDANGRTRAEPSKYGTPLEWGVYESWDAGNFPIQETDFNDPERGPVKQLAQLTTDTTTAGSSAASAGTVTTTRFEAYNEFLRREIVETWSVPRGLTGTETITDFGGGTVTVGDRILAAGAETSDEGISIVSSVVRPQGDGTDRKITKQLREDFWPTLIGTEFDSRFGVLFDIAKTVVDAGTTGSAGTLTVTEVQPLDKWRSIQIVGTISVLPSDQVWYGTRNHTLPDELISFSLAGSSTVEVQFDIRDGYSGPCQARFTRSFTDGPPTAQPAPTIFRPQSYSQFVEYSSTRTHETVSQQTSSSDHSGTSAETSTSSGQTQHDETSQSENSGTTQSEHQSTEQGTSATQQSGTHESTEISEGSRHGNSTSNSDSSAHVTSQSHSYTVSDGSEGSSGTNTDTSSYADHTSDSQGSDNSDNSFNSEGSTSGSSSSEGTSDHTSTASGTSSGNNSSTSQNNSSGVSNHTSSNSSSSNSTGTSQQTSSSSASTQTTATSILQVNVPKTLRDELSLTHSTLGISIVIPATDPIALPHGDWIVVDSQSEHWKFGVWVTETIEILVP